MGIYDAKNIVGHEKQKQEHPCRCQCMPVKCLKVTTNSMLKKGIILSKTILEFPPFVTHFYFDSEHMFQVSI